MNFTSVIIEKSQTFRVNQILYDVFVVFNSLICGEVIGVLGIVGNVINIVNFSRQGFSDSVTVTLTALAVSDIGVLVTIQGANIMVNPWLSRSDLDFSLFNMVAIFFFYPHGYFMRVSGLITTFAAVERCVSVIFPLKVKVIFTHKVALAVNVVIFVSLSLYLFPVYYCSEFGYVVIPETNRTVLDLLYRNNADYVLQVSYLLTDLTLPYFTFIVTIVCTVVITVQLKTQAKWRSSVSTSVNQGQDNAVATKQKKTTVMLVTVSVIFIVCLIPQSSMLTALSIVRELKVGGAYFDIAMVCYSFTFLMETINCSVSILVYYNMSSRYRAVAQEMFSFLGNKIPN